MKDFDWLMKNLYQPLLKTSSSHYNPDIMKITIYLLFTNLHNAPPRFLDVPLIKFQFYLYLHETNSNKFILKQRNFCLLFDFFYSFLLFLQEYDEGLAKKLMEAAKISVWIDHRWITLAFLNTISLPCVYCLLLDWYLKTASEILIKCTKWKYVYITFIYPLQPLTITTPD